jgi:tRNA G10  N-methylase Trm11
MQNKNILMKMAGSTKYIFTCSKAYPHLARRELERYYNVGAQELAPGIFQLQLKSSPQHISHFGFTQSVHIVREILACDEYLSFAKKIQSPYKLQLFQTTQLFQDTQAFADTLHPHIISPVVDLKNPAHTYTFFFLPSHLIVGELLEKNTDKPTLRKAHKKKHLHPTSLDPQLAKAMIALSAATSFHDPFCGVGGIVIEGLLQGKEASGSDLVATLVGKAKENALSFSVAPSFFIADATALVHPSPAFISDLPYGKNSLLVESKEVLYKKFFVQAKYSTTLMVLGSDHSLRTLAEAEGWSCEEEHEIYAHKSLTRFIGVFSLKKSM